MATPLKQNPLIIIGVVAVLLVVAFVVIAGTSNQSSTTAANTPTPTENANSIRTQVAQELTQTAQASSFEVTQTALVHVLETVTKAAEVTNTLLPPTPIPPTSNVIVVTATPEPQILIQPTAQPTAQPPTQAPQSMGDAVWTLGSVSGPTTLGSPGGWTVFQVWDGKNSASVVHGVIEPGWTVTIPTVVGSQWTVTNINRDTLLLAAVGMRDKVVKRDHIAVPPLVYVGTQLVDDPYTTTLPKGWSSNPS